MQLQTIGSAPVQVRVRTYTPEEVGTRLAEAMQILAALPSYGCRPAGYGAEWRFAVPSSRPAAADEADLAPSAISRMEEALTWPGLLPSDMARERKVVILRACDWTWARIGREVGMSGEGARLVRAKTLQTIARELTKRAVRSALEG